MKLSPDFHPSIVFLPSVCFDVVVRQSMSSGRRRDGDFYPARSALGHVRRRAIQVTMPSTKVVRCNVLGINDEEAYLIRLGRRVSAVNIY